MTVAEDRRKWNQRYQEREAPTHRPDPHPLALRWRERMAGGPLLDAACGLGRGLASGWGLHRPYIAVDLSEVAIRAARRLWAEPGVHWVVADVAALRWPPDLLGLACAFGFTDWAFLQAMRHAIRPGGLLLYEGFSRREMQVRPGLNPQWTAIPAQLAELFRGWSLLECEESSAPPFLTRMAVQRPGP